MKDLSFKQFMGLLTPCMRCPFIVILMLIVITHLGCTSGNDKVFNEFKWLIDSYRGEERWVMINQERNWHVVYRLTDEDIMKIRAEEFREQGFLGWKQFSGKIILYGGYVLDGDRENIVVNEKVGSNKYNGIRIYIEFDKRNLILEYGITSRI